MAAGRRLQSSRGGFQLGGPRSPRPGQSRFPPVSVKTHGPSLVPAGFINHKGCICMCACIAPEAKVFFKVWAQSCQQFFFVKRTSEPLVDRQAARVTLLPAGLHVCSHLVLPVSGSSQGCRFAARWFRVPASGQRRHTCSPSVSSSADCKPRAQILFKIF